TDHIKHLSTHSLGCVPEHNPIETPAEAQGILSNRLSVSMRQKLQDVWASSGSIRLPLQEMQKFLTDTIDPLFHDIRSRHLQEMSLDAVALSEEQKFANQYFLLSSFMLVSTTLCAFFFPPLLWIHAPIVLYLQGPMYRDAYKEFREKGITSTVVDGLVNMAAVGFIFMNLPLLVVASFGGWIHAYSKKLVAHSKYNASQQLTNLFGQQPKHVWILQEGVEVEIPFEQLETGHLVVLDAGQMIPVDGIIEDGIASIDQQMLTGEAQPAEKGMGDVVYAATVVLAGRLVIRVEQTGEQTTAAQIGQILEDTSSFTAKGQLRGKAIADRSAVPNLLLGLAALPVIGLSSALAVAVSRAGRSMNIVGPLSVMNFLQLTAHRGILIKDGRALEQVSQVDTVVFDKTGTLTQEVPHVGRIFTWHDTNELQLLAYAAAAEQRQTHPIARAILHEAEARGCAVPMISEAAYEVGYGIKVMMNGQLIRVGSQRFMHMEAVNCPHEAEEIQQSMHELGHSLIYVAVDAHLVGVLELVPTVRPEAQTVVDALRQAGMEIVIISGDHERPTRALAESLGIDRYFAETLPENKADLITQLQSEGKTVCFVGDGINDAIALKKANISVSISGASTIATDTAQIILMDQTLNQLATLFALSEKFESNMSVNLATSIIPSAIAIIGALTGVIGFGLCLVIGSAGLALGMANATIPKLRLLAAPQGE
ncbi:MAG: heavy metal translocating P-type ATPase, partial [Chloroflexota bacterium]